MSQHIGTDERRRPAPKFARRFAVAVTSSLTIVACLRVASGYATALRSSPTSL